MCSKFFSQIKFYREVGDFIRSSEFLRQTIKFLIIELIAF